MFKKLQWASYVKEVAVHQFIHVQEFKVDQFIFKNSQGTNLCTRVCSGSFHVQEFSLDQFVYESSQWASSCTYNCFQWTSSYTRVQRRPVHVQEFIVDQFMFQISQWTSLSIRFHSGSVYIHVLKVIQFHVPGHEQ